ncbi:N-methylhydantoinase B [Bradyrhizobium sp. cir1]|uniref:hydantoinase B/oxoprolinase family protein n=1 Tax=Bradyrhizobium sp. cir1 TaxID=1445730 RepID=UPI001606BCAC|nr:hydantoinase B/oxoprolinase family protein [Bradyrhizobium sp. cir1]MBB4368306.1 N-methylhydantoinase B [Bradyrhizobium sp. cir1]
MSNVKIAQTGISRDQAMADPISMEVFSNRLLTITEEMGNTLIRSSFSTNIKERKDCSVGLFDKRGRLVAQASHIPLHLGSLRGSVQAVLKRFPVETIRPGTAFISNDPYLAGGTHMPDISVVTPMFADGQLRFFTANIAHHSDVGGSVPGSVSANARTVFEEGIRLPPILIVENGKVREDLLDLIAQNTREPEERVLDIRVQMATNDQGNAALDGLIRQMGIEAVEQAVGDILSYTARRLQMRIDALGNARGAFTCHLDDDGSGGDPVPVTTTVWVENGNLVVDFAGTGPQARGALNVSASALDATVFYAVKALLDPQLMPNEGMMQSIDIRAEKGLIVNARFPAATGARSITCQKIARAIFGAFRQILPADRLMASGNDDLPTVVFSAAHAKREGTYVYLETLGGGGPATGRTDGMNAVHVHVTNTSNLPIEALENEYPLRVDEYSLVERSGGAGRYRGGLGLVRQVTSLQDGTIFSARSDGHKHPATGVAGGGDGKPARLYLNYGQDGQKSLPSKVTHLTLNTGENIRIETGGGGGLGNPAERPEAAVRLDLENGYIGTGDLPLYGRTG